MTPTTIEATTREQSGYSARLWARRPSMTTYLGHPHDSRIWQDVADERDRQDAKWGDQSGNSDMIWGNVLTEEVGESAQAALKATFQGEPISNLRAELVQVAAVAVAWVEAIDRRGDPA